MSHRRQQPIPLRGCALQMSPRNVRPTIVDVLENALDGDLSSTAAAKLSIHQATQLETEIARFHKAWQPPALGGEEYRVSLGFAGDFAGSPEILVMSADEVSEWDAAEAVSFRRSLTAALLYGDSVVVRDPTVYLSFLEDPAGAIRTISRIGALAPLIRDGVLILAPRRPDRQAADMILEEARAAVANPLFTGPPITFSDEEARMAATALGHGFFLLDLQDVAWCEARILPADPYTWWNVVSQLNVARETLARSRVELKVIPTMGVTFLPAFDGLSVETICAIHRDEEALADWRAAWRSTVRTIEESPFDDGNFADEAQTAVDDLLGPAARAVRRATSSRAILKRAGSRGMVRLVVGGAIAGAGTAMMGGRVTEALLGTVAGTAAGGVVDAVFGRELHGSAGVLARLMVDPHVWPGKFRV